MAKLGGQKFLKSWSKKIVNGIEMGNNADKGKFSFI